MARSYSAAAEPTWPPGPTGRTESIEQARRRGEVDIAIAAIITTNRRACTQVGSALERHAEGQGALAVREKARELADASVSANTRRTCEGALRRLQEWLDGRSLDDATLAFTGLTIRYERSVDDGSVREPLSRGNPSRH